jgi:hypothetical protein
MTQWRPYKRRDFIKRLKKFGFEGPCSGTRHKFMIYGNHRLSIPSNRALSDRRLDSQKQGTYLILVPK